MVKIGTKLLTGFLLIALVLFLMISSNYMLSYQNIANENEIDTRDSQLITVHSIHRDMNMEFSLAMLYVGFGNGTMADRALDQYSSQSAENSQNMDRLDDVMSGDDDHSARVQLIRIHHQEMTDAFEDYHNAGSDDLARKAALEDMSVASDDINTEMIALESDIREQQDELYSISEGLSDRMMVVVVIGVMSTIVLAVSLGVALSRHMVNRIRGITNAAGRIKEGDLSAAADESGNDEISDLSRAFNQMMSTVRQAAGEMGMDEVEKTNSGPGGNKTVPRVDNVK